MRRIVAAAVAVVLVTLGVASAPAGAVADKDCSDFATQKAAQEFFDAAGPGDPHRLDADGDGIACESNPCPCAKPGGGGDGGGGDGGGDPKPKRQVDRGKLVKVVDGDTIDVRVKGKKHRIRVIGIDTPEVYGGKECGGPQASQSMKKMVHRGQRVTLKSDPSQDKRDRYGRWLRYVEHGGRDLGFWQVKKGWAEVYVYNGNPFERAGQYKRAAKLAKQKDQGVWDACKGGF